MPYGLNHRRSLEDLVPSGQLRIFNPTNNYLSKRSPTKQQLTGNKLSNKGAGIPTYFTSYQTQSISSEVYPTIDPNDEKFTSNNVEIHNEFIMFDTNHRELMHQSPTNAKLQHECSQRLIEFGKRLNLKKEKQRNEALQKTLSECKFVPTINKKTPEKSRNQVMNISKTSKTFEQFYENQVKFQQNKYLKMEMSLEKKYLEEESIMQLSNMRHSSAKKAYKDVKSKYAEFSRSKVGSAKKENFNILEPSDRKLLNKTDTLTFIPQINKKSQLLKRDSKISDHLPQNPLSKPQNAQNFSKIRRGLDNCYAKNRRESKKRFELQMDDEFIRKRSMSNNSIKYIWEKLKSEFYKCIRHFNVTDPVDEDTFCKILINLGFFTNKKQTKVVNGKEIILEDALMKKIMHILRMPKVVATGLYNRTSGSFVTLSSIKAFLAAITGVSVNENDHISLNDRLLPQGTNSSKIDSYLQPLNTSDSESECENKNESADFTSK